MKLEAFVKSLKVGEHLWLVTTGENCRDVIIWRAPTTGEYFFASSHERFNDLETPEELLKCLKKDWLEYDFEFYKPKHAQN